MAYDAEPEEDRTFGTVLVTEDGIDKIRLSLKNPTVEEEDGETVLCLRLPKKGALALAYDLIELIAEIEGVPTHRSMEDDD
jgi:hypothetical protein